MSPFLVLAVALGVGDLGQSAGVQRVDVLGLRGLGLRRPGPHLT